ncbi:hypothetical protein MKW92_034673 [Papaver armeniacum]|nr:hypothetical protein MKW92_034673 [Papaver armeniacum]
MVFSGISSTLLRRNPFKSKSISSFSSISFQNNFNLTTISKFQPQIFSNPRTTDFFQIREYSVETPSLIAQGKEKEKKLAHYDRKVILAYEAVERVEESKRSWVYWPSYKRDAKRANNAINLALKKYYEALSILSEDERKDVEKANGRVINQMLDMQKNTMSDELMNFDEVLKIWNKTAFGEEDPKGSGGTAC